MWFVQFNTVHQITKICQKRKYVYHTRDNDFETQFIAVKKRKELLC